MKITAKERISVDPDALNVPVYKADIIFSPFPFIAKTKFHFVSWINLPIYTVNSNDSYSINQLLRQYTAQIKAQGSTITCGN